MLKRFGFIVAAAAAGAFLAGGVASAATPMEHHGHQHSTHHDGWGEDAYGQVGLVNLGNTDLLHNVNLNPGVCGNDINVLGVQVPIRDSLSGIGVPLLSPGENESSDQSPSSCAAGSVVDGGSSQGN